MKELDTDLLTKLAGMLTGTQRLQDGVALAGTGLVLPLARVRQRSARLELARVEQREGGKSSAADAQRQLVAALDARAEAIADEHARRATPADEPGEGQAAISGVIGKGGKPQGGVGVFVFAGREEQVAQACTRRDGRYALTVPADTSVRFELRIDGKTVFRDRNGLPYPAGYRAVRDIDFGDTDPVCGDGTAPGGKRDDTPPEKESPKDTTPKSENPSEEPPKEPPAPDDTRASAIVPDLTGLTPAAAKKALATAGLELGDIDPPAVVRGMVVVRQKPAAGRKTQPGSRVDIFLGTPARSA